MRFTNVLSFAKVKQIIQNNGYMYYELFGYSDNDLSWQLIGDSPVEGKKDLPVTELVHKLESSVKEFEDVFNVFKIDLRKQHNHGRNKTFSFQFFTDRETFEVNYKVTRGKGLGARSQGGNGFSYNQLEAKQEEAYRKGYEDAQRELELRHQLEEMKRSMEELKRSRRRKDNTEKWIEGLGTLATMIGIPIIQKVAPESMPTVNAMLQQFNGTEDEYDDEEPI